MYFAQLRAVGCVALMIVENEVVELEFAARLGFYLPEQERADRVALHKAVKQTLDLFGLPDKFSLNRRKDISLTLNTLESLGDGSLWLVHRTTLERLGDCCAMLVHRNLPVSSTKERQEPLTLVIGFTLP